MYYAKEDNVFADIVKVIQTGSDVNTIYSNLMTLIPVNPEIEKQFVNTVYDAITSVVTFEQPVSEYWNSNAFVYNCDMDNVTGDNLSATASRKSGPVKSSYTGVGNLFNTADEDDEPISLKPILSGSKTATTTAPKSSYTGVGNLFNTGSTTSTAPKSSYTGVGNLFNTADEDEPETSESMFDYLNKRIDNLQDDVNQKFDTILERLD